VPPLRAPPLRGSAGTGWQRFRPPTGRRRSSTNDRLVKLIFLLIFGNLK
jgi:hypothetical protein